MNGHYEDEGYRGATPVTVTSAQAAAGATVFPAQCILMGFDLSDGSGEDAQQISGSVTAPAALATITSITLPQGDWLIHWTTELTGTPGAGELNNMSLILGGTFIAPADQLGAVGIYPQKDATIQVAAGGQLLKVSANGVGTAGAVYHASIVAVPAFASSGQIFDGGQFVANVNPLQGSNDRRWYGDTGILITNSLVVKTILGTLSGAVYVYPRYHPQPE